MKKPNHPGDLIRDCLDELKINVTDGAKALGVTRPTLSRLLQRQGRAYPRKWPCVSKRRSAVRRAFGFGSNSTTIWRRYRHEAEKFRCAALLLRRT